MNVLFKELESIKPKKRTTYKKTTENTENEKQELPPIGNLDGGFLFHNSTLEKVKKRLANDNNEDYSIDYDINKESSNTDNNILKNTNLLLSNDIQLSQTQLLKNMYGGGEDLESIEKKQQEERKKKEVREFQQKKREAKRRQREEARREQELLDATQIIYQKYDLRNKNRYRHNNRTVNTSRTIEETFQELEKEAQKAEIGHINRGKDDEHIDDHTNNDEIPLSQSTIPLFYEKKKSIKEKYEIDSDNTLHISNTGDQSHTGPLTQTTQIINMDNEVSQTSIKKSTQQRPKNIPIYPNQNKYDASLAETEEVSKEGLQYDKSNKFRINENDSILSTNTDLKTQVFYPTNKQTQIISTVEEISISKDKYNNLPNMGKNVVQSIPLFSISQKIELPKTVSETNIFNESSTQIISNSGNSGFLEGNQRKQSVEEEEEEATQPTQVITTQPTQNISINKSTQFTQEIRYTDATQITQVTQSIPTSDGQNSIASTIVDTIVSGNDMTATIADDATGNLRIHEIQRQLENEKEEDFDRKNKEYRKIEPTVKARLKFTKDSFLANFDSDLSESETEEQTLQDKPSDNILSSNPNIKKDNLGIQNEYNKELGGLTVYKTNLKTQMDAENRIELDSDGDSDLDLERGDHGIISNNAKATILNIRAKLSKTKKKKPQANNKGNLGKLLEKLRKKSRRQILDYQTEIMESKGLTRKDLEKEKEVIENLLEREILRNQKIRQREKEREKQKQQTEGSDSDFDHSANEIEESIFVDEDEDTNEYNSKNPDSEDEISHNKENKINDENVETKELDDDEEFRLTKQKKSRHIHVSVDSESDNDSEVEITEVPTTNKSKQNLDIMSHPNTIFLGHYGDNLDNTTSSIADQAKLANEDDDEIDETEEATDEDKRRAMIDEQKYQQRLNEQKLKERRKELEGLTNLVEEEAEESEDEWYGIGGADGEDSDDYDSEIEKMIDDYSKTDMNLDEIRRSLVEENKNMDIKMINKILYDIKNGNFRKRGRSTLELEISDDEDDELRNYRLKRRELMRKRLLDLGDNQKLINNPKSKAFFDSLVEDIIETKNPFGSVEEPNLETQTFTSSSDEEEDGPSHQDSIKDNEIVKHGSQNKKVVLSEAFVHKSLSFLNSNGDLDEYERNKKLARLQHGDDTEDLFTLKQNSSIKSFRSLTNIQKTVTLDDNNDDINTDIFEPSRPPSIIQSFSSKTDINDKFKEGSKTVKISKSYKTVGGSKASITYMSKIRKLVAPKANSKNNLLHNLRKNNTNSRISKLFNNEISNFGK